MKIKQANFNIEQICNSGQCFRMSKIDDVTYRVIAKGHYLEIVQNGEEIEFFCTEEEFHSIWYPYFDFDTCYGDFIKNIDKNDLYLQQAGTFGDGIRILRQDLWEMIVTFIISQQNNIKRIKKCVETLCEKYGEVKQNEKGENYYCFPTVEALSKVSEEEFRECNLGYRSKYLVKTSEMVLQKKIDFDEILKMDFASAKKELLKLVGVGEKVADCICLFALHHMDGFPMDTHMIQVLEREYHNQFPYEKYKGYLGVIQQYIFYYDLWGNKNIDR